jgi:hypothetical protein
MSDDEPADTSAETLSMLIEKHPSAPADRQLPASSPSASSVSVHKTVPSFPAGSSCGHDSFRHQHLFDLVTNREDGTKLLSALTTFVNTLLQGRCHPEIVPVLFEGRFIDLSKASGGIRPIAVGYYTLRRRTSKCASAAVLEKLVV